MSRIQTLSASVVNQIAAGEVIERPASVVKELLENSLDALASRIEIDVVAGGSELIRIVDDGEGIHPDDLVLAVTSHATSKLQRAADLFAVQTFGFRGEALASIAEVSRFKIRSRRADDPHGHELEVTLGAVGEPQVCGASYGTTIEVRQLFENVPVRRKFLKSVATEFGQITEHFTRIALAHPRLHLVLKHNERTVYQLPAVEGPLDRIQVFFGSDLSEQLIPVESEHAGIRIWGYVGHPALHKPTRKQQFLYLNGRWIQDRTLQHALTEAYRGLIMVGRHPVAFLFLELPTDLIDVNVHPTKAEVRFQDVQQLFRQLLAMLRSKFLSLDLQSRLTVPAAPGPAGPASLPGGAAPAFVATPRGPSSTTPDLWSQTADSHRGGQPASTIGSLDGGLWASTTTGQAAPNGFSNRGLAGASPAANAPSWNSAAAPQPLSPLLPSSSDGAATATLDEAPSRSQLAGHEFADWAREQLSQWSVEAPAVFADAADLGVPANRAEIPTLEPEPWPGEQDSAGVPDPAGDRDRRPVVEADGTAAATMQASGAAASAIPAVANAMPGPAPGPLFEPRALQIHDCYLVVETPEGVTVIDQHALHERILYEQFRRRVLAGAVESQRLLLPIPLEVTARDAALLLEHHELLDQLGFGIEEFGRETVLLTRHPVLLGRAELVTLVKDLADRLESSGGPAPTRRDLLDTLLHMMACKAAVKAGQRLTPEEISALLEQRHLCDDAHHCPHGRPTALTLSRAELDRQFGRLGA